MQDYCLWLWINTLVQLTCRPSRQEGIPGHCGVNPIPKSSPPNLILSLAHMTEHSVAQLLHFVCLSGRVSEQTRVLMLLDSLVSSL